MTSLVAAVLSSSVTAALITFGLNRWATKKDGEHRERLAAQARKEQQRALEDWELRKYKANQRINSFRVFTDLFYATTSEIYFLNLDLRNLEAQLIGVEKGTEAYLLETNPTISALDLQRHKTLLLTQRRQELFDRRLARLDRYNNNVKSLFGKAQSEASICAHYLSPELHAEIESLIRRLDSEAELFSATDAHKRLQAWNAHEPEFRKLQHRILSEDDLAIGQNAAAKR